MLATFCSWPKATITRELESFTFTMMEITIMDDQVYFSTSYVASVDAVYMNKVPFRCRRIPFCFLTLISTADWLVLVCSRRCTLHRTPFSKLFDYDLVTWRKPQCNVLLWVLNENRPSGHTMYSYSSMFEQRAVVSTIIYFGPYKFSPSLCVDKALISNIVVYFSPTKTK